MGKMPSEQLRKVEKSNRLVTAELKKIKKCHILTIFPVLGKLTHMCDDLYLHIYWNLCCVCICVVFVFVFSFAEQSRVLGVKSAAVRHLRVTRSLDCDLPPIPTNPSLNTRHHEPACPR